MSSLTSILFHRRALSQNLRQLSSYVEPASIESNATNAIPKPSTFVQDEVILCDMISLKYFFIFSNLELEFSRIMKILIQVIIL